MKYRLNKGLVSQKIEGKTVIFDGDSSILYTFNSTATLIFQKLKLGKNIGEITDFIVAKFKIEPQKAKTDIEFLLADLKKKRILLLYGQKSKDRKKTQPA